MLIIHPSPTPPIKGGEHTPTPLSRGDLPSPLVGEGVLQFINRLYLIEAIAKVLFCHPERSEGSCKLLILQDSSLRSEWQSIVFFDFCKSLRCFQIKLRFFHMVILYPFLFLLHTIYANSFLIAPFGAIIIPIRRANCTLLRLFSIYLKTRCLTLAFFCHISTSSFKSRLSNGLIILPKLLVLTWV